MFLLNLVGLYLVIAAIALFVLGILLVWLRRVQSHDGPSKPGPDPGGPLCPPPTIPDKFDEKALNPALAVRLAGNSADGTTATHRAPDRVIWVDRGDEVLVHLDSVRTQILDRMLLVSVDLETDQTGRTPLVVAFALGDLGDPAGLVAVTDEFPRGNGLLASRWGKTLQEALWASLLDLAGAHAKERSSAPMGVTTSPGILNFQAGTPPSLIPPTAIKPTAGEVSK